DGAAPSRRATSLSRALAIAIAVNAAPGTAAPHAFDGPDGTSAVAASNKLQRSSHNMAPTAGSIARQRRLRCWQGHADPETQLGPPRLHIKRARSKSMGTSPDARHASTLAGTRVLIVEDDALLLLDLEGVLRQAGAQSVR